MKRRSGKSIFAISIFVLLPYKKCKPSLRTVVNHVPGLYTLPRAEFFDAFSVRSGSNAWSVAPAVPDRPEPPARSVGKTTVCFPEVDNNNLTWAPRTQNRCWYIPFNPSIWLWALIWYSLRGSGGDAFHLLPTRRFSETYSVTQI
jgi:hypothetical protein